MAATGMRNAGSGCSLVILKRAGEAVHEVIEARNLRIVSPGRASTHPAAPVNHRGHGATIVFIAGRKTTRK